MYADVRRITGVTIEYETTAGSTKIAMNTNSNGNQPLKRLTESEIEDIVNSMPDGIRGFAETWGYLQFANLIMDKMGAIERRRFLPSEMRTIEDVIKINTNMPDGFARFIAERIQIALERKNK